MKNAARATLLCLAASLAFGQQVFRATTKLVQVSVIAHDKDGKPVADLRREDFQIFDNGSPQEVRVFVAEKPAPSPPELRTPNTFTNQIAANPAAPAAGAHSGYSVILIDNLQASFGDPDTQEEGAGLARLQTLKMLRSIPAEEKVAIYATGRTLKVICEFTTDRALLERELGKWVPRPDIPETALRPLQDSVADPPRFDSPQAAASRQRTLEEATGNDMLQRLDATDGQMEAIADHLAGIPGRKNLLWLSNRFAIGARAIQKFSRAAVSVYPVDMDGVCRVCSPRPVDAMNGIAAATGGLAYYKRNDIDIAMREAVEDGMVSYTLGFYQPNEDKKATLHQIGVRVSRPGLTLRYRTSYQTEPANPVPANPVADLVKAMNRPVDATTIALTAKAIRSQDRLDLSVSFDISSLDLAENGGLWKGSAELVARFMTADGVQAGDVVSQTVTFNLRPATYASMLQNGGPLLKRTIKIPAKAVELKLLVGSLASGKIGTLTIPLSEVGPAKDKAF